MRFLDVNTFYGPKAGGIRTYHHQKVEWFKAHPEHQYLLVGPGPALRRESWAPNVEYVQLRGFALTEDPEGYRFLTDLRGLKQLIEEFQPDVLEAGEPWLTGLYAIWLKKRGRFKGILSSFYHSDPIRTYFEPWAHKGHFSWLRRMLVASIRPLFFAAQRSYDLTLTSSYVMQNYLQQNGVMTQMTPFGAPKAFFEASKPYPIPQQSIRVLYAGRLNQDKGIELLIEALPELLEDPRVHLTVAGRGSYEEFFRTYEHPRYHFAGYVGERRSFLELLQSHHLVLAPGPHETFALGVLEAMALGLPVIGPDRGGTAELLSQVPGALLFESDSVEDMIEVFKESLNSELAELSKRHRAVSMQYGTWEKCFDRMFEVYQSRIDP